MREAAPGSASQEIIRVAAGHIAAAALALIALAFWLHWEHAAGPAAEALEITGFEPAELPALGVGVRAAGFAQTGLVPAEQYRYVRVHLSGHAPADKVYLLWETARAPGRALGAAVPWTGGGPAVVRMSTKAQWSGAVARLGVGVSGPTRDTIRIERLVLEEASAWNLALSVWQEWTGFEGQRGHSMNFVAGGAPEVTALVRPVPALAALLGLSLLLYFVRVRRRPGPADLAACTAIFVAVWLIADVRWSVDLLRQNLLTVDRYGGKTLEQKRLAAEDPTLYEFAREIFERLPAEPQPLYVLVEHPDGADRYLRLRLAFHLLPHNVHAYGPYPPAEDTVRPGYAVVANPNKWIAYDKGAGVLRWRPLDRADAPPEDEPALELPATPLFEAGIGTLYRIE